MVNKDETDDLRNIGFNNLLLKSSNGIYAKDDSQLTACICSHELSTSAVGLAQSVERLTAKREVAGSNRRAGPIPRVLKYRRNKGTSFEHALQVKWW